MNKQALIYGAIGGVFSIVLSLLIYTLNPEFFGSWMNSILGFWLPAIILMVLAGIAARKANGGYLKFGDAFLTTWLTGLIMGIIGTIFSIILFNVVDTELENVVGEVILQNAAEMFEKFGFSEAAMEQAMMETASELEGAFSPGSQLLNIIWIAIFVAVVALIVGLIVKRNPPENV